MRLCKHGKSALYCLKINHDDCSSEEYEWVSRNVTGLEHRRIFQLIYIKEITVDNFRKLITTTFGTRNHQTWLPWRLQLPLFAMLTLMKPFFQEFPKINVLNCTWTYSRGKTRKRKKKNLEIVEVVENRMRACANETKKTILNWKFPASEKHLRDRYCRSFLTTLLFFLFSAFAPKSLILTKKNINSLRRSSLALCG